MKIVTNKAGAQFFLLASFDDLVEFHQFALRALDRDITVFLKNLDAPLKNMLWGVNDSIVKHQTRRAELGLNSDHNKLSPICNLDTPLAKRFVKFQEFIERGLQVLVNSVGGFQFMSEEFESSIVRTDVIDVTSERTQSVVIKEQSKYINLENDPILEPHTMTTLSALDAQYGYIVNLRLFNKEQLAAVFSDFVKHGGHTVHVYTTGSDVEQMYQYAQAAVSAGVPNLWIQLNSGISESHRDFEKHVSAKRINLKMEAVSK